MKTIYVGYIWTIYPGTIWCMKKKRIYKCPKEARSKYHSPSRVALIYNRQECIHVTTNGFIGCCLVFYRPNSSILLMVSCSGTHANIWVCFLKSLSWSTARAISDCTFWAEFPNLGLINSFAAPCKILKKWPLELQKNVINFLYFDILHCYFTVNYQQLKSTRVHLRSWSVETFRASSEKIYYCFWLYYVSYNIVGLHTVSYIVINYMTILVWIIKVFKYFQVFNVKKKLY